MNQLNETLESMRGKKIYRKTLFGDLQGYVPDPHRKFKTLDNPHLRHGIIPQTGALEAGERMPKYVALMASANSIAELLGQLADTFDNPLGYERPEEHDCTLSEEDGCEGCEAIAEILED